MVYNNFLLRLLFSLIFILTYIIIFFINFNLIFYLILIIYLLIFFEIYLYFKKHKVSLLIYLSISFLFFYMINFDDTNYLYFNLYIFIVIIFDIFSYVVGKLFGRNKLIKISPNKTIEGLVGGVTISLLLSILLSFNLNLNINLRLVSFICIIIISSFIGDIIESFFKRKNYLKNSSEIIPGHGGLFDRFDSFLFSIIFYSISINFLL